MKVIIDTNGLMLPAQWGVDIFDELSAMGYNEYVVPSAVSDELNALSGKVRGSDRAALAVAKEMLKKCEIVKAPGFADDVIMGLALELKAPVLTNDAQLRSRLKRDGVRTIFLRGRQKLEIE